MFIVCFVQAESDDYQRPQLAPNHRFSWFKALFGELFDDQRIDLTEMILTKHVITVQFIENLIDDIIQKPLDGKNNGMFLFEE